ncbi:hypothetical protein Sjap_020782 [Stephania japonica]|uniref:TPX2 central domain-containing protein n=1 Tax=Stephania japonica TaxID=461633 RepID=A0AAP0HVW1_9MAGN
MDEEMDCGGDEGVLVAEEVDFDYEYDATRYFDFVKGETAVEVREAEMWFDSAQTYPPSPFVIKLNLEGILEENDSTFAEPKERASIDYTASHSDTRMSSESIGGNQSCRGLKFNNHFILDVPNAKSKTAIKAALTRGSTLMKPTVSHLAKQNRPRNPHVSNRSLDSSDTVSVVDIQASKRQKLDGGQLCKQDDHIECNMAQTRLKLTIPREPDLETAHRAYRMRFLRLLRYHFQRRAYLEYLSFISNVPNSSQKRSNLPDRPKGEECDTKHIFKAHPLNKKIFSSKGDIGIFRNNKREVTVPMVI